VIERRIAITSRALYESDPAVQHGGTHRQVQFKSTLMDPDVWLHPAIKEN